MSESLKKESLDQYSLPRVNELARYMLSIATDSIGAIAQTLQRAAPEPTKVLRGEHNSKPVAISQIVSSRNGVAANQVQIIHGKNRYIWDADYPLDRHNQIHMVQERHDGPVECSQALVPESIKDIVGIVEAIFASHIAEVSKK